MTEEPDNMPREEIEALYNQGATALFLAIEDTDWRDALDIAEAHPKQVRTWVRSTGTENTTFQWSMWRRLPIHEACRRAAPAWLVSSLLSAFPESAGEATQLGELPLHLAVDGGAAPEVVNLIIVANWSAIVTPDQSGRIPTDILDRNELLLLDDHRIVHESLTRCHKAYTDMLKRAEEEQVMIEQKNKAKLEAMTRMHRDELIRESEKQEEIRQEVGALDLKIEDLKKINVSKDHHIRMVQEEKDSWLNRIASLEQLVEDLQKQLANEKQNVNDLIITIKERDADIENRDKRVALLSSDLQNITAMHGDSVMQGVLAAEKTMRAMVSSQISLQKEIAGQANGLKALLEARGISPVPVKDLVLHQEEKRSHPEEEIDHTEAASALAAAAMAALHEPE